MQGEFIHMVYVIEDLEELRLYYEFLSAGVAAFIIKWIPDRNTSEDKALKLLTDILLQTPAKTPALCSLIHPGGIFSGYGSGNEPAHKAHAFCIGSMIV